MCLLATIKRYGMLLYNLTLCCVMIVALLEWRHTKQQLGDAKHAKRHLC